MTSHVTRAEANRYIQLLPNSVIAYEPPFLTENNTEKQGDSLRHWVNDWLQVQHRYANICDQISSHPHTVDVADMSSRLREWYCSIPREARLGEVWTLKTPHAREIAVCLLYQYREAQLALLEMAKPDDMLSPLSQNPTSAPLMSSLRDIFAATNKIEGVLYDQ